jgi:hypothetical protein
VLLQKMLLAAVNCLGCSNLEQLGGNGRPTPLSTGLIAFVVMEAHRYAEGLSTEAPTAGGNSLAAAGSRLRALCREHQTQLEVAASSGKCRLVVVARVNITTPECVGNWRRLDITLDDKAKGAISGASHEV